MYGKLLLPLILFFLLVTPVSAGLVINEVQVEPEEAVEIVNSASESADLSGWILDDSGGTTFHTIQNGTIILPRTCIVIRGSFNFNKATADIARLIDKSASTTASVQYTKSPGINQSWQRMPDEGNELVATSSSLGLWNVTKQSCIQEELPTPSRAAPTQITYPQIQLSEILSNPTEGNEWVELYNPSSQQVTLENWFIDDVENAGSSPYSFSLDIPGNGYETVLITKNMINNSGDSVRLLSPEKTLIYSIKTEKLPEGKTYSKQVNTTYWCITDPSPNIENLPCTITVTEPLPSPSSYPSPSPIIIRTPSTSTTNFPTISLASGSAVLGITIQQKPQYNVHTIPYQLIRFYEIACISGIIASLLAMLCYTENTQYALLTHTISSLVYPTRKKRI